MKILPDYIVDTAQSYLGQAEIPGNQGFINPIFEEKMKAVGWERGDAWCAAFTELVWREACKMAISAGLEAPADDRLNQLFSLSTVATFENFLKSRDFRVGNYPERGSLICWRSYVKDDTGKIMPTWTGHIGIVTGIGVSQDDIKRKVDTKEAFTLNTIEGNSNNDGSREGVMVVSKMRLVDYTEKLGLVLRGFIYIHL